MLPSLRRSIVLPSFAILAVLGTSACSSGTKGGGTGGNDAGTILGNDGSVGGDSGGGGFETGGETGLVFEGGSIDAGGGTTVDKIYASTDSSLYQMDPMTNAVSLIGAFSGNGTGSGTSITDVAVDGEGDLFVNSETVLYKAALPAGGTGSVVLTSVGTIATGTQKFFALAFTPSGLLETGAESLVAGDDQGNIYLIPNATTSPGTPVALGGFGKYVSGDPTGTAPYKGDTPDHWELSGDIVFWTDSSSTVHGVATLCLAYADVYKSTTTYPCAADNDVLAEIDIAALQTKSATASLRKGFFGTTGTKFGKIFGAGAWGDKVYGFTLGEAAKDGGTATPAQLISIDSTGVGTSLQTFASISDGWTGAGVSTKAVVTLPDPIH